MTPSPTTSNVLTALRSFLLAVLPSGTDVVTALANRVPEPRGTEFVVMTPIRSVRLRTNVDSSEDVKFTGSIAGATMTVTSVDFGVIDVGATVFGVGVADGTTITALGTGTGGAGTYTVAPTQTVTPETLSSGAQSLEQGAEITVQLDFHSAGLGALDMAQTVSTTLRDPYGFEQFANQSPNYGVAPLLADDPKQMPFINESQQFEWRWVVEALLQANVVVGIPQQYADSVDVDVISVDATYPP